MSEIVFILGAGASKEAGAPVMADFPIFQPALKSTYYLPQMNHHAPDRSNRQLGSNLSNSYLRPSAATCHSDYRALLAAQQVGT